MLPVVLPTGCCLIIHKDPPEWLAVVSVLPLSAAPADGDSAMKHGLMTIALSVSANQAA